MKEVRVEYEVGLVTYVDILGFGELIDTKTCRSPKCLQPEESVTYSPVSERSLL
jgi:hypothetical protein